MKSKLESIVMQKSICYSLNSYFSFGSTWTIRKRQLFDEKRWLYKVLIFFVYEYQFTIRMRRVDMHQSQSDWIKLNFPAVGPIDCFSIKRKQPRLGLTSNVAYTS
jgi:hypothetical protein